MEKVVLVRTGRMKIIKVVRGRVRLGRAKMHIEVLTRAQVTRNSTAACRGFL